MIEKDYIKYIIINNNLKKDIKNHNQKKKNLNNFKKILININIKSTPTSSQNEKKDNFINNRNIEIKKEKRD